MSPYGWWARLVFDYADRYTLVVSEPVVREITEVLHRPDLTRKYRPLATRTIDVILNLLAAAQSVDVPDIRPVSRDPKDDKFLATAKAGQAKYAISEDRDLLDIGEYEGIKIITAEAFLRILTAEDERRS
jgi:putative PIN family toxin of toxin-antitoxin system